MLSVQIVEDITPIVGADLIEVVRIQGWNVVVSKDRFAIGDKVAYFEIDSFLPSTNHVFESFQKRSQNTTLDANGDEVLGHVVRTIKLRGVYSQGIVMGLDELGYTPGHISNLYAGDDISAANGVFKWEEIIPEREDIIGSFDSRFSPKSGSDRVQNLSDHWVEIVNLEWEATLKVDGTSQTILNDGELVKIMGHNWELDPNLSEAYKVAKDSGLVEEVSKNPKMAIQFELVGPGISKNRLKLSEKKAFVFAVWIDGVKLSREEWPEAALKLALPILDITPSGTIDELIEKVSELRGNITKDVLDEGVVFHIKSKDTPMWMSRNASFKIVSPKYLVKHKL